MKEKLEGPKVVNRNAFQVELDALRIREKAHTHEGDAIAAARRRLPMVELDPSTPLVGPHGAVTLLEGFAMGLGKGKEPRLGDAWIAAVRHYYVKEHLATLKANDDWYPPSIFYQAMKYMVFGDPSLAMPGPP